MHRYSGYLDKTMTGWYSGCFKDQRLQEFNFQVVHRPGDKHGSTDGLSRQCSITPELTDAERLVMFGSCSSANSLEYALGRINLVAAEDAHELMSIQFQEDVNSLRLAVSSTKYRCKEKNSPSPEKENQCWEPIQQSGSRYPGTCYPQRQAVQNTYSYWRTISQNTWFAFP